MLRNIIRSTGFYRVKAINIIRTARNNCGKIQRRESPILSMNLSLFPGVGRKSANVILRYSFFQNRPAVIVDTHFRRVVKRVGLNSEKTDPDRIEAEYEGNNKSR